MAALEKAPRVILPKNDPDPPAVESLPEEVSASNGKVQTPEVQSANDVVDVEVPPADGVKTARQNEEEMPADDEDPGSGSSSSIPNGYMARALAHLESEIDAHTPVIPNVEAGDCIAIFFPFDSAQIGPRGQAQLSIVGASVMNQAEASIQVKGYSDSIGKAEYNQKLIAERVNSVVTFLGKVGVPQNQVEVLPVDAELAAGPYREQPGLTAPEGAQAERKVELALLYD
ncbi:MAG: OmpA family protein [Verrucomicrobiota bacterium]